MNNEIKKTQEKLRCLLTDDEKIEAGKELAEQNVLLHEIEEEKAQIVADFKARSTAAEARISVLSTKIRSGYEFRPVDCHSYFDKPEEGQKQLIRLDTGEVVRTDKMTEEEKQRSLPLEVEEVEPPPQHVKD